MTKFPTPSIDWAALSPELVLLGGAAVCLLVPLFLPHGWRRHFCAFVSILSFVGAGAAAIALFQMDETARTIVVDAVNRDRLAELAQVLIAGSGLLAVGVSYAYVLRERMGEYYTLLLTAAAGMCFFVAANNLMTMFLGLEWFSISLYILCAIAIEEPASLEAGLKYLIVGSFGSAILLFGSAFVYGATGAIGFADIAAASGGADQLFLVTGLAMIIVGLGFKASAAPFHMWTPDVYQGAPTPVTAFMSAATKIAALVLTMRLLVTAFPSQENLWTISLAVLVCISLAWGNLGALVQTDVKRMLAYSSISHAGFLLMPIAVASPLGGRALMYYLISYAAMSIGAFAIVAARERELARPVTLDGMAGMGWERPGMGAAMTLFMFGFIGLPPAGLFIGKFYAFSAAVDRGWAWLAVVGAIATVVSIYYYLGVVRAMYFQPAAVGVASAGGSPPRELALGTSVLLAVVVTIGSFIAAQPLLDIATDAGLRSVLPALMPKRVVVLGAGVSGEAFMAALRRLDKEVRITLVEEELVGGECSYRACIPSKTLLRPVEIAFRAKSAHGVEATLDPEQIFWWRDKNAGPDDSSQVKWVEDLDAELVRGKGVVTEAGKIDVDGSELAYDELMVSTGSRPTLPPIEGLGSVEPWLSREGTSASEVPESLVVVGGGAVGLRARAVLLPSWSARHHRPERRVHPAAKRPGGG